MALRCLSCCAVLICLLAALFPFAPWVVQHMFWHAHQAPSEQVRHVPKYPPDIKGNLVRGIPTNSFITDRRMDFLEHNFTHTPNDVWIITYQKVGTTWTQYIVSLLLGNARETSLIDMMQTCAWPEVGFGIVASNMESIQKSATTSKNRRCFKSHWPRKGFFRNMPATSKIIYVLRDAEDVAVSYFNHMFNLAALYWLWDGDMTWDQYFDKWFHGDLENGGYFEHVASWWEVRGEDNILLLRFEELQADKAGTIRRIASFLGASLDDVKLADILDATSKDNMRKWNEGLVDKFLISMGVMRGDHVRKDGAKKVVSCTDSQRARMVEKFNTMLKPIEMPFKYMFTRFQPSDP